MQIQIIKEGKIFKHVDSGNLIRIVDIDGQANKVIVESVKIVEGRIKASAKPRTVNQREIHQRYVPFVRDRADELCLWRSAKSNTLVRVKKPLGDKVVVENVIVTDYEILPVPDTERTILATSLYRHYN